MTNSKHPVLDRVRLSLIFVVWIGVTVLLWRVAWYWGALWLIPGFVIALNVMGLAMTPIYRASNARSGKRLLDGLTAQRQRELVPAGTPVSDGEGKVIADFINAMMPPGSVPAWQTAAQDRLRMDTFDAMVTTLSMTGTPAASTPTPPR